MNGGFRGAAWLLAAWCATTPALAQDSERSRYYIQQMIELAATNDEAGVNAMQRMLEQEPRPAPRDPAAARAALQRGQAALRTGDLNVALTAFQQAGRDDPGNVDAVNHLGLVERKLGQFPDAERDLQRALALEPTRASAWFQLAQVYGLSEDGRRARGALANTYRFAQNPMRAEEILRNIAESEASDTLRTAAVETLRLYQLPVEVVIVPPLPTNPGIVPLTTAPASGRKP
ncbi:MAG: tetratricopeptide repeat protein [Candidatus Contendobacter sp.]|nr:tetratricopeptide repeat protein [Candidatus Contendobacter sp.]MDS4057583.1 tetratricopeptide repeat protein [Candidatus Contendobacter sp.]